MGSGCGDSTETEPVGDFDRRRLIHWWVRSELKGEKVSRKFTPVRRQSYTYCHWLRLKLWDDDAMVYNVTCIVHYGGTPYTELQRETYSWRLFFEEYHQHSSPWVVLASLSTLNPIIGVCTQMTSSHRQPVIHTLIQCLWLCLRSGAVPARERFQIGCFYLGIHTLREVLDSC